MLYSQYIGYIYLNKGGNKMKVLKRIAAVVATVALTVGMSASWKFLVG